MMRWWSDYLRFRDRFAEAIDPRLHAIAELDALVWSGRARLWASDEAAIVAELKTYPTGAVAIEGLVAAGDLDGVRALIAQAEQWGKKRGAILARIESRPGWARALKADGYAPHQLAVVKEL